MTLQKMVQIVYGALCHVIGTPEQVASRREIVDMMELFVNLRKYCKNKTMVSGSIKEGFRLKDSDADFMFWLDDHRVIWDFSQSEFYSLHRQALILCDSSESPPGFTLLWLPLDRAASNVMYACVCINQKLVLSSSKYREITLSDLRPSSRVHGPCSSGILGTTEYDDAHCFVSDFWPPSAYSWIDRCHSWPPPQVVNDIVRNGCHFVAIGHKLGNHEDNEWRISFSKAEYKLMYSMNQTQFLTYGLLKIFIKEIFNKGLRDEDKLLCSYHLKTAVFWAIQQNMLLHWCPQNLLVGFWACFKLLLKWVYEGVCPNFFIPQNNMFLSSIHGKAQRKLFMRLYRFYVKGIASLYHSSSIGSYLLFDLCVPRPSVNTDVRFLIREAVYDGELFREISSYDSIHTSDLGDCMRYLQKVEQLVGSNLTEYQTLSLQRHTATTFQCIAFILHNKYANRCVNKQVYTVLKKCVYMLKFAASFGCISDMLYIAMYYYKTLRYREALSVIEKTKVKLAQPFLIVRENVDSERYTEAVGGRSLCTKMKHAVAMDIRLKTEICYINELMLEQQSSRHSRMNIPPVIVSQMLEILCCKYIDPMRTKRALDELQFLVLNDPGKFIGVSYGDISWEILGICQQILLKPRAALYSYQQSLRQRLQNNIQSATRQRINYLTNITYAFQNLAAGL